MKLQRKFGRLIVLAALAWGVGVGAAIAQVEQARLRIDGMT
ncbi:MAG: hypothetical protein ACE5GX_17900 [Thermoanaerobaculia bacterium]